MAITWPAKNNYATGDVLTAANMNGIGDDLNALFDNSFYAGKNKIINGDFGIWQRGTSISQTSGNQVYTADRFLASCTFSAGTASFSQQTFTAGTAPVAGYEGTFFGRQTCGSTSTAANLYQRIESVRTFAGQTVTFSFWAKASTALTYTVYGAQVFGSGGSANVDLFGNTINITTSWQRFTQTITIPSISGKTIGTNDYLLVGFYYTSGTLNSATIDTWGWQLEAGSTASPFQTATGTIQGELAACQRYYQRQNAAGVYTQYGSLGTAVTTGIVQWLIPFPVTMRTSPSSLEYSNLAAYSGASGVIATPSSVAISQASSDAVQINFNKSASFTQDRPYEILSNNTTSSYIGWSAEL